MNIETGQIHEMLAGETLRELATRLCEKPFDDSQIGEIKTQMDRVNELEKKLVELGNLPVSDCPKCNGRGFAGISQGGNKIPCDCTNPL